MRKIEERFPNEVVVIGVHSAKFPAEGETFNLRQAVMRHDIRHPVVNDREFLLWRAYAVRAWPTLVIVDPEGRVVGSHAGEFDGDLLGDYLADLVAEQDAAGKIDRTPLRLALEKQKQPETLLAFPAKLLADVEAGRLWVADTDHHRVLEFGLEDGLLLRVYGAGEPGFADGPRAAARLRSPHGLARVRGDLYVADTGNHALRRIRLATGDVETAAGTGEQASPWPQEGEARGTALNSPWDLLADGETLYVAMAGSHQVWTLDLPSGQLARFAGDGREALLDGPRRAARLAQPSGLASDGRLLWIADSETSSVRYVPLLSSNPDGELVTSIGQGLFEFGDRDGSRRTARLQHVLDVAAAGGLVYAADSYNNKIKVLDPDSGLIRAFAGSGEPGLQDGPATEACFWEPGGLSAAGDRLFVADTNNHAVRVLDRRTGEARTLALDRRG